MGKSMHDMYDMYDVFLLNMKLSLLLDQFFSIFSIWFSIQVPDLQ